MRTIKLIILIFALSGGECNRYQGLKGTSYRDKKLESLMESAVLTLLSCYEKKVDTVGGIGITEPILEDILLKRQPLPVKLFGYEDEKRAAPHKIAMQVGPHKLHLFVAETSPIQQFEQNIRRALESQPSAHMSTFLIIDWPSQNNKKGCPEATKYLMKVWSFYANRVFYVCVDKLDDRALVYTFNPYTNRAPAPWMLNKRFKGYYDHPCSLFVREYRPGNQEMCTNLDFVKTRDLGAYKVQCFVNTGLPFSQLTPQHAEDVWRSGYYNHAIVRLALDALNATPEVFLVGTEGNKLVAGNFRNKMSQEEIFPYAEIFVTFVSSVFWRNVRVSIPVMQWDYAVATHHKGEKSQLDKLIGVFDRRTRLGICLVIIATWLFFYFFTDQSLGRAMMNVIRIIGNTGLLRVPNGNAPRLYLAGIFILVVTIIGVYQGLLAALLTKPSPLPEVETLEDLANSPHKIYLPDTEFIKFFKDPKFNGRLSTDYTKCDSVRNIIHIRPSEACVLPRINLMEHAIKQNLHVSRETIIPAYAAYWIKTNWDLEERFNEILASFQASRITWHIYERDIQRYMERAEYKENVERNRPVVMKLSNLGFAFAFLGLGLSLATIVLAIEIAMGRRQLRRRKARSVRQHRVDIEERKVSIPSVVPCVPDHMILPQIDRTGTRRKNDIEDLQKNIHCIDVEKRS